MWDIRYRPRVFSDVLGQEGTTQVLCARLLENKAFETSYIFAGGHGSGKTTLARILARAMFCQNLKENGNPCNECEHCLSCLDETLAAFTELDAASQGTTADMRKVVDNLAYAIPGCRKKVYLLDEAHRMSRDAQDVLLKPIEDKRIVVILCTTEFPKIRGTIKSRCETYEIRKIPREAILERMKWVLREEKVDFQEEAILTVIDLCQGHVRDVLNKLETVAQLGPVTVEAVRERLDLSVVSLYYEVLLSLNDAAKAIPLVEAICDRVGPAQACSGLAEAAMNAYRHSMGIQADYSHFDRDLAKRLYETFGDKTTDLAGFFLQRPQPTNLSLVCDVLSLCGGKALQPQAAPAAPPVQVVQVVAPLPLQAPPEAVPTPQAPSEPAAPKPLEPVQEAPASPAPEKARNGVRADGVGPLGSSDPDALTKTDHVAVPLEKPRGRKTSPTRLKLRPHSEDAPQGLTRVEFTHHFNSLLNKIVGPSKRPN